MKNFGVLEFMWRLGRGRVQALAGASRLGLLTGPVVLCTLYRCKLSLAGLLCVWNTFLGKDMSMTMAARPQWQVKDDILLMVMLILKEQVGFITKLKMKMFRVDTNHLWMCLGQEKLYPSGAVDEIPDWIRWMTLMILKNPKHLF